MVTNGAKANGRIDKALFLRLKFGDTSTRNEQILRSIGQVWSLVAAVLDTLCGRRDGIRLVESTKAIFML